MEFIDKLFIVLLTFMLIITMIYYEECRRSDFQELNRKLDILFETELYQIK